MKELCIIFKTLITGNILALRAVASPSALTALDLSLGYETDSPNIQLYSGSASFYKFWMRMGYSECQSSVLYHHQKLIRGNITSYHDSGRYLIQWSISQSAHKNVKSIILVVADSVWTTQPDKMEEEIGITCLNLKFVMLPSEIFRRRCCFCSL